MKRRPIQPAFAPGHSRLVRLGAPLGLLCAMLLVLAGCSQSETPKEDEATSQSREVRLSDGDPASLFVQSRVEGALYVGLPKAIAEGDVFQAQELCELSTWRIKALQQSERGADLEELASTLNKRCSVEVSALLLDQLLLTLEGISGEDLSMRCNGGARTAAFLFDHRSSDSEVAAKRKQLFEKCPALGERWKVANEGQKKAREAKEKDGPTTVVVPR